MLSSLYFFGKVGKAFVPEEDEGRFVVRIQAPLGSSLEYTKEKLIEIEKILLAKKEATALFSSLGFGSQGRVNEARIFVTMQNKDQREISQDAFMKEIQKDFGGVVGVRIFASKIPITGGQRGEPLQFALKGSNLIELEKVSKEVHKRLLENSELGKVDLDLQLDLPQIEIIPNRDKIAQLGLSTSDVANAISVIAGGSDVARYNDSPGDGQRYQIRIKGSDEILKSIDDLKKVSVKSKNGELVKLGSIVEFKKELGAAKIPKVSMQYGAFFYASPNIPLGEAVKIVEEISTELLPQGYTIELFGQAKEFKRTSQNMMFAFGMATLLLYAVLASQFNSFVQPLLIMVAEPLALVGGVAGLWLMNHTLNIYSMIGLVLLIGLVAKNSILLVDLTNRLRAQGKDIKEALMIACPIRLRPILMTSFTVILAMLPASIGVGAGSGTNGPLGVAIIGGMLSSTLLTLVVLPSLYSIVEGFLERRRKEA